MLQKLTTDTVTKIIDSLGTTPNEHELLPSLKQTWPEFRFFFCSDDDIEDRQPFHQSPHFSVHLVAASFGCGSFTLQPENAVGVLVAVVEG